MVHGKQNCAASDFAQLLNHVASWQAWSHGNAWTRSQVTAVKDLNCAMLNACSCFVVLYSKQGIIYSVKGV